MTSSDTKQPKLTRADLEHFTGDFDRFQTMVPSIIFTRGVKFLAERAEALWLIDLISSWYLTLDMLLAIAADPRLQRCTLHFWRLVVRPDQTAVVTARADRDVPPFITEEIPFTDFPLESVDVWSGFDGRYWTLYLPSEH